MEARGAGVGQAGAEVVGYRVPALGRTDRIGGGGGAGQQVGLTERAAHMVARGAEAPQRGEDRGADKSEARGVVGVGPIEVIDQIGEAEAIGVAARVPCATEAVISAPRRMFDGVGLGGGRVG